VSAPLLLTLGLVESARARSSMRERAALCLPAVVGISTEATVRMAWHSAIRAQHWNDVRTQASFDVGHFGENLTRLGERAVAAGAWPWFIGVLLAGLLAVAFLGRRARLRARDSHGSIALGSVAWTVVGSAVCTWLGLALLVATRHVRENGWAPRYFGIPLVFAILGVAAALGAALETSLAARWPRAAGPGPAVAALAAVIMGLPSPAPDPRAQMLQPMAERLARHFPGAVLLDGYWRTYALAAFVAPGLLVPIPAEGEWNRRPDWVALLQPDRPVLIGTTGPLLLPPGAVPPPERVQYGVRLALVRPDVAVIPPAAREVPEDRLSLYRVLAIDAEHGPAQHPRN
jgi:MFS family permease